MKGSTWVTVFLVVALGIVGYLWYSSTNNRNQVARDLSDVNNTPQVGQNQNTANPAPTNPTGQLSDVAADIRGQNAKKCTDCHKPGSQYSLSNETKNVKGHPSINTDDPNDCIKCHGNASKPYAFRYVLHKAHLGNDQSHFVTTYNGRCTTCHKMQDNGQIILPEITSTQKGPTS